MPTAEAQILTDRASRYLAQLCRHASQMGRPMRHRPRAHDRGDPPPEVKHVEWSDTYGIVSMSWGQWTMQATPDTLTVRAEAADEDSLRRIQDLVAERLGRFGRRDHLTVSWQQPDASEVQPDQGSKADGPSPAQKG
jgi:hypothetical protein